MWTTPAFKPSAAAEQGWAASASGSLSPTGAADVLIQLQRGLQQGTFLQNLEIKFSNFELFGGNRKLVKHLLVHVTEERPLSSP